MANVRGGDIRNLNINGRDFNVAADSNVTYRLSGFNNTNSANGDGSVHTVQRRKLGGVESLSLSVDAARGDVEFLQTIWNNGIPVPVSMTLASSEVYAGSLVGEGELNPNTGDGQIEIAMMGERFEKV